MALEKHIPSINETVELKPLSFPSKAPEQAILAPEIIPDMKADLDVDYREVYFLIMHFLSSGPCQRTCGQFWNELLEHDLLPRRYHSWYSRSGAHNGDENDDGLSFPLSYNKVVERYPHIEKGHLVKLLQQLLLSKVHQRNGAADVPTLLGTGSFSLLGLDEIKGDNEVKAPPSYMRWPHLRADQVRGLRLREIGGGFSRHHRAPSTRAACYTIAKPSMMVQKMQNTVKLRGHRNAVYCATFDQSGRLVITGSDDRLVKIWSMENAHCLASCRGHEGDITDLAVSSNNALVASASNDFIIRVWRLQDGQPVSVLQGHTGAVTAIAFSPRHSAVYQLLSSSDDGTCRLWDARHSHFKPRIYLPKPPDPGAGKTTVMSATASQQSHQIFCCAFNATGTIFVTGSSDHLARVWNALKCNPDDSEQAIHEMDVLSGHENDVNYVQFSGCSVTPRFSLADATKEESFLKLKKSWFAYDSIVTCSRDGSAIIWSPKPRKSHKVGRWIKAYHLKVPPPPMPPQPPRGGPRQRVIPAPRGVNMIIWSLDNRFVLAAIMDCRICVWNAVDGGLVHCLTGHTDSTYVLDVHPFNPRLAMSAGYDGKTIIWDIWEGKPIRTFEIGRFKLVDGKFSPDGTSIILSDDVGQLYILSTGQGESQKDAKYDQFFLGDYRPLIRDTSGNVIDQETQLSPFIRNIQDLLCDSSMIPYPEPYQSMYQRRRLATLGIEWRPSSVRFAVGPDFNSDQDQLLPLPDWDVLIDPLPEFVDAMDWEPELEVISDDSDSEFNVTDSIDGEEGPLSSSSSSDLEGSDDQSEPDSGQRDSLRRSKRRKKRRDREIMTSSGRRVKKRNLDVCDGSPHRVHQVRKLKSGRKLSKKKSLKASRPRRVAAQGALTLFSKIKGRSPDGDDEYGSESESPASYSLRDYSDFESEDSDRVVANEHLSNLKGKEVLVDNSDDLLRAKDPHRAPENASSRRLILKLPMRDSTRGVSVGFPVKRSQNLTDGVGSSSTALGFPIEADEEYSIKRDAYSLHEMMKWGGFGARTPKRLRLSEAIVKNSSGSGVLISDKSEIENCPGADLIPFVKQDLGTGEFREVTMDCSNGSQEPEQRENPGGIAERSNKELVRLQGSSNGMLDDGPHKLGEPEGCVQMITLPKQITAEADNPVDVLPVVEHERAAADPAETNDYKTGVVDGDYSSVTQSDALNSNADSVTLNSHASCSQNGDRRFRAVYQRSRSFKRARTSSDGDGLLMGGSSSNLSYHNVNGDVKDAMVNGNHLADAVVVDTVEESIPNGSRSNERSRRVKKSSLDKVDQFPRDEWGSGITAGHRSTRNRRSTFIRDLSPVDNRKSSQTQRKLSWLMLTAPDHFRYIPQLGDEVAYLRQGHQDYLSETHSRVRGPWEPMKGEIRAVEFCRVNELEYSNAPGSGDCCCKLLLQFIDPSSSVCGKSFKLTLPELTEFPDFLVERTRYEVSIQKNWSVRDKCQVWWKNESGEDGSWWEGRITAVKPKSPEFPDSPWESYSIVYKGDPQTHFHSPWELFETEPEGQQPHLDDVTRKKLMTAFTKLQKGKLQDSYGVQKLRQASEKTKFLNRFPVPLSLDVIHLRLESDYYRCLEAVKHDVMVMLSNAESYFAKNAEMVRKTGKLSEWFSLTLSEL